jgi:hypothetical protein
MSIDGDNIKEVVGAVSKVEQGLLPSYEFGAGGWVVLITREKATFVNEDYAGVGGVFSLNDFKWVLKAWWEFLLIPEVGVDVNTRYEFSLPERSTCILKELDGGLLKVARA